MKIFKIVLLCSLLLTLSIPLGCERTVYEEVIRPVERMVEQKDETILETAVAKVKQLRSGLRRYPAISTHNVYLNDTQVFNYDTLRKALTSENLPLNMGDLMWDPAFGIHNSSEGLSFAFQVSALTKKSKLITATERGVEW
jgi:hypothetical protein